MFDILEKGFDYVHNRSLRTYYKVQTGPSAIDLVNVWKSQDEIP